MPKRRMEHGSIEAEVPAAGLISLTDVMGSLVKVFVLTIPFLIESGIFVSRSMAAKLNRPIQQNKSKQM